MFKGLLWATDEVCILHDQNLKDFADYVNSTNDNPTIVEQVKRYHKQIPKLTRASKDLYVGVLIGKDVDCKDLKLYVNVSVTDTTNSDELTVIETNYINCETDYVEQYPESDNES